MPAASYDQDYGLVGDVDEFCANLLAFHWARRGTDFLRFFSTVLARKPTTSFNHHVQAITICQWLGDGNIKR